MMGSYIRPDVRDFAGRLKLASDSADWSKVQSVAGEVERWLECAQPNAYEYCFLLGVMRYCARISSPDVSTLLTQQAERLAQQRTRTSTATRTVTFPGQA